MSLPKETPIGSKTNLVAGSAAETSAKGKWKFSNSGVAIQTRAI
jgi:hypothetical protein